MKAALLYATDHGMTRKIVKAIVPVLRFPVDVFDVAVDDDPSLVEAYDLLLFFTPTCGDEELQADMEDFIDLLDSSVSGKFFAICELGNLYGYDDFSFGAMKIVRRRMLELGAREICTSLSLDSFPRFHAGHLGDWIDYLNSQYQQHE